MANGRTDRNSLSAPSNERVEWAIRELKEVLADRADDPHAQAALEALRDAFCVAHSRASLDPLTGLMNRTSFDQALELALSHAARTPSQAALMFMDLDGFKCVNDRQGHPAGDRLLKEVAGRIVASVRDDDLLARYGGDEFVVLLDSLGSVQVIDAIATRIIEALSAPLCLDTLRVRLSISIGVALFPEHGKSGKELIRRADAAMYRAKHEGGERYLIWSPEVEASAYAREQNHEDQSGAYARLDGSQRSTADADMPLRRA
jgi:diguanylate cyclase (GGDEF)-like protein